MDGVITALVRRTRSITLLAAALCALAMLAPTTARAATGKAHSSIHLVKVVALSSTHQHLPTLRLDQPHAVATDNRNVLVWSRIAATATSATIVPSPTADSPRMRGPPAKGCC
ncbi:MAG: hypothetical protein DLM58_06715 [Pseudonocardiales bacterium]|nr:MAG: hypothetical protein DLM58_06715 [Pseudonocardiales bacterium]